ncbi:MAG: hypothetical protein GXP59_09370 [Deltaproteobacteria bacterium]|nr:hypothetical protein [Deltaproteobacteria bacterium]
MQDDTYFEEILNKYRADPYDYIDILTAHTGLIRFSVNDNESVAGPSGEWHHIAGSLLYELERERNRKKVFSASNGVIASLEKHFEGKFVEAGEKLMTIRHPLKKREIIDSILRHVLSIFPAPERAKYFFCLDIQSKIEKYGQRAVSIKPGDELFTMSLMKRDTPIYYEGEPGIIHSVYFSSGDNIDQGTAMIGVCPQDKLSMIQKIIERVKAEWN